MDIISVAWEMDAGRPGVDADPTHPLHRALARLIATGKPFSRMLLSMLRDGEHQFRWFGAFVEGKRTMFFPGFATAFDGLQAHRGDELHTHRAFAFDHLTLENDRKTWHITTPGSSDHWGSPSTKDLGDGRVLWFGLSFRDLSDFLPMFDTTQTQFESPPGDAERRRQVIMQARQGAQFPAIQTNLPHLQPLAGHFLHISVIAGPPGFETYLGSELALPFGSPYLRSPLPEQISDLPVNIQHVNLSDRTSLQITLSRVKGELSVPVTFTSPGE